MVFHMWDIRKANEENVAGRTKVTFAEEFDCMELIPVFLLSPVMKNCYRNTLKNTEFKRYKYLK